MPIKHNQGDSLSRPDYTLLLVVFVEDDESGDDAGHPSAKGEQEDNQYRSATFVNNRQRREDNSQ